MDSDMKFITDTVDYVYFCVCDFGWNKIHSMGHLNVFIFFSS